MKTSTCVVLSVRSCPPECQHLHHWLTDPSGPLCFVMIRMKRTESAASRRTRGLDVDLQRPLNPVKDGVKAALQVLSQLWMMENSSMVSLLTLSGLSFSLEQRIGLFVVTLLWYLLVLVANLTVIVVIVMNRNLHEPMYVFLCNLCVNALYGTVGFYPKFLLDLLSSHVISYAGCMLQGYVIHSWACADFSMLALMAYDRYVAICRPLSYQSAMTKHRISLLVLFSWLVPLFCMFMNTATLLGVRLCGSHIHRLYCVNWMIVVLACSPILANTVVAYFNIVFYFGHGVFVFCTYIYVIRTCMSSRENQGKFMQTCLPHLVCLLTFICAVLLDVLYIRFGSSAALSQNLNNFMAIEFLLVPPLVNPLIYGFKLTKLRNQIGNLIRMKRHKVQDCEWKPTGK